MKTIVAMAVTVLGGCLWMTAAAGQEKPVPAGEAKKVAVGKNVFLEVQGERRRVLIHAQVCLRAGSLEMLLTRTRTKEHESILAATIDARDVHTALFLARATEGRPAQLRGKFVPASGMSIKITVEYEVKGKRVSVPAQHWVRTLKTKQALKDDWVFAGSCYILDPIDPTKVFYGANDGDVICLSNFEDALLDLPIESTASGENLFEAHTERIPAVDTPVLVILEPVLMKKEKK